MQSSQRRNGANHYFNLLKRLTTVNEMIDESGTLYRVSQKGHCLGVVPL